MKVIRYTQETVNKNVLRGLECAECRNKIETKDIYTLNFATNKKRWTMYLTLWKLCKGIKDGFRYDN